MKVTVIYLNLIPTTSGGVQQNGTDIGKGGPGREPFSKRKTKQRIASIHLLQSYEILSL
jgi:hypothetical protein